MFLIYNKICKLNHLNISVIYRHKRKKLLSCFFFFMYFFLYFTGDIPLVYTELKKLDNIILGN